MNSSYYKPLLNEQWNKTVFFGVKPVKYELTTNSSNPHTFWFVREVDIETLPFYDFWMESAAGSACLPDTENPSKGLIYTHDWERFCRLFIATGKHRYNQSKGNN